MAMTVTLSDRKVALMELRVGMVAYLAAKIREGKDLHAIADAAMDLREVDAKLDLLSELEAEASR